MTERPEPMGMLDATLTRAGGAGQPAPPVGGVVNGPEGEVLDWDAINWRTVEDDVRRLRQRIFTASQAGDLMRPAGVFLWEALASSGRRVSTHTTWSCS